MQKQQRKRNSLIESPTFTKILSFFLALILWFFVSGDNQGSLGTEIRRTFEEIPLAYRNLGDDLVVVDVVDSVKVTLQGIQQAFDGLTPADREAYINLNGKKEGRHEVRIAAAAPPGMSVVRIEPASSIVVLEDLIALQMPVEPEFRGENRSGMIVDEAYFEPEQVFVQGPRNKVDLTKRVVFYLNIETAKGVVRKNIQLYPLDSIGRIVNEVTVFPEYVDVEVNFAFPQKDLPVEAVFDGNGLKVEAINIEPSVIAVQGPKNLLEDINVILTEKIPLKGWESGMVREIPLIFPEGVRPVAGDHGTVQVRIFFVD
jgi:YbbR domain-containing protein